MYTFQGKLILLHISVQTPSPFPPFLKGEGWDFWKMAVMRGWKIYTRNGGKPGMRGELALKWGDGTFVKSLYIVGRGVLTSYFMKIPLILPTPLPPLFQILTTPLPRPPSLLPTPTPTVYSVVLFLWLNGWSRHIWCTILLNDNNGSTCRALVP